ncbi:MBOAT family protein [Oscillospiraceae bacterium OttesenSCG-928-F05]|nr:MBOAT family protein [Oscillospiraceae bacterium OttesenSCG-928-F05]
MVFSSLFFLYIFFPVAILLYFVSPTLKIKNFVLMLLSLVFYAWGEPIWVLLLIFSAVVDYTNGRIIGKYRGRWQAKAAFVASIAINLGLLATFKYSGFLVENINAVTGLAFPVPSFALPVGISFYTFQTMSYSIDVYRDRVKVQKSFGDFLLFVSLFPQLIAGPILRYAELEEQLHDRKTTPDGFFYGITRFLGGLSKKVLLANYAGAVVNTLFEQGGPIVDLTVPQAWLGILMYAFQIYFDFSGYSDMAIGLGRMFGFQYSENFDHPYVSRSVTEFWRRWHISLSSFFRDYVYIPLGGNRRLQVRNMFVVWALTGLWHGASWNFVLWGLYYFAILLIEKYLFKRVLEKIPRFFSWFYAFFAALIGWVFFYFTDLGRAGQMFMTLFGAGNGGLWNIETRVLFTNNIFLVLICAVACTPLVQNIARRFISDFKEKKIPAGVYGSVAIVANTVMLLLCTASLVGSTYNPFIYFRF